MSATANPTGLLADPAMGFLAPALEPEPALAAFRRPGGPLADLDGPVRIARIDILRHKPGRRCLIAYDIDVAPRHGAPQSFTLLGKARAKGLDRHALAINQGLWLAGIDGQSRGGVGVPRPRGAVNEFRMWFQERVPGEDAEPVLIGPDGPDAAERIAGALVALQRAAPVHERRHTISDELAILEAKLGALARARPDLKPDLREILDACRRLAGEIPAKAPSGIHRDFHQGNILIDGERVWVVDLDLYARGYPATDAGNLSAHLIELALRGRATTAAISTAVERFEAGWLAGWQGAASRRELYAFTTLALARLIAISDGFPDRRHTTGALIELCRQQLETGAPRPTAEV